MDRRQRFILPLILIGYLVLGVAYTLVVPLGESPDEVDHVRYVQILAQEGQLPIMQPIAGDNLTMEANQPPLYYALGAGVWRLFSGGSVAGTPELPESELVSFEFAPCFPLDPTDPGRKQFYLHDVSETFPYQGQDAAFFAVRLLSLLMGAGTVTLAFGLGRQLAPTERRVGLLAAALLAFNPQYLFITASVNNDVLTALLGAAIVFVSVAVAKRTTLAWALLLGALLGLGALTKLALFALWPVAILALLLPAWRAGGGWRSVGRRFLPYLALTLIIPVLLAGWWYGRAQMLYGDPLAWDVHLAAKGASVLRQAPLALADLRDFVLFHFHSYWATFGWLNIRLPAPAYWFLAAMLFAAGVGLLLIGKDRLSNRGQDAVPAEALPAAVSFNPTGLSLNLLAVAGVYLSLLRYIQTINWSGYQGRLAYAVVAPVAAVMAVGLWRLGGRALAWLSSGGLGILALASLIWVLMPAYARPLIFQPKSVNERPCVRMGDWQVEGANVPDQVLAGDLLTVVLHGYGLEDVAAAPLLLDLVGRDGAVVGQLDENIAVQAGEPFSVTLAFPITEDAQPARGLLRLAVPGATGLQPLTNARGQPLESPYPLAWVKIAPRPGAAGIPQNVAEATFGERLALLGYDTELLDDGLALTLYWQVSAAMDADYAFFVHLIDGAGEIVAQWDGHPHGGAYPTSIWGADEIVIESVILPLVEGGVDLAVGVYDPGSGLRLPAFAASGARLPDDRYLLDQDQ